MLKYIGTVADSGACGIVLKDGTLYFIYNLSEEGGERIVRAANVKHGATIRDFDRAVRDGFRYTRTHTEDISKSGLVGIKPEDL